MSNETHRGWSEPPMSAESLVDTFGRMMQLPFSMMAAGMRVFGDMMSGMREVMAPGSGPSSGWSAWASDHEREAKTHDEGAEPSGHQPSGGPMPGTPTKPEESDMADTNLSDDMVKLVAYNIVTIERGDEAFLVDDKIIVKDNMTADAFSSWVISINGDKLKGIDGRYLRVAYDVQGRWPKQDLEYEEKQLKKLDAIADAQKQIAAKK